MIRLLLNKNIPIASFYQLDKANIDVVSISKDSPGISDKQVMKLAREERRTIVTFDSDYGQLIYRDQMPAPAGLVYLRFIPDYPEEPAEFLIALLDNNEIQLEQRFTVADRRQIRQRNL